MNDLNQIWCPACDQGWIGTVTVPKLDKRLYVCQECETTWESKDEICDKQGDCFSLYMEKCGLKGMGVDAFPVKEE